MKRVCKNLLACKVLCEIQDNIFKFIATRERLMKSFTQWHKLYGAGKSILKELFTQYSKWIIGFILVPSL